MSDDPEFNKRTEEVKNIADEICRYLKKHPSGSDTLEGVIRWWITRQRLIEAEDKVRDAVDYLCSLGILRKRILSDGTVLYSSAEQHSPDEGEKQT